MPEERKLVTILFADVTGSTTLGETMDLEDVRTLMGRYYDYARQIITEHGGTLEKFIGDAVMAIFGLPQAHSDDAERALAAALALRTKVLQDEILKNVFSLCIGINTGEVIAANDLNRKDFLVTGDVVNVAARLQQNAGPGNILVGERTKSAGQTAFHFATMREINVRGKAQALKVYTLEGSRNTRLVERPPFVGRKQDLLQLFLLQGRAIEEQRAQLVSVIAPAGTGKTRLLEEFFKKLASEQEITISTMRCLPYGQTITYWPLRTLLNSIIGSEFNKEQVARVFAIGGYEQGEALELADHVLAALGIEKEGATDRECIFAGWRRLIELTALQKARIIVFEDLHWASDSLLDLIEYLLHGHIQAPLLFVTLSRPELIDRRPHWGGGWQNFASLSLQPLTAIQTRTLVKHLLETAPTPLQEQIVERSGGNPFFVLELVRGLSEHMKAGGEPTLKTLPDTIHAAILARIDLLVGLERRVLQVASVSSRTFRLTMLQAVLEEFCDQEIEQALENLIAQDFIMSTDRETYIFCHILIRDVAYNTLARTDRIHLHSKMATSLEQIAGTRLDEYIELIAYHYREAVSLARQTTLAIELPIECDRAIRFLRRASEMAHRAGAITEACKNLESALEIATADQYIELYEQLGDSLVWGDKAFRAYQKALAYSQQTNLSDALTGARLLRKLLLCQTRGFCSQRETPENLATMLHEAYQLVAEAGDEDELWHIHVAHVFYHHCFQDFSNNSYEELKELGMKAADYFAQKEQWSAFSEALDGCTALALQVGAYHDGIVASQRRLQAPELSSFEYGDAVKMLAHAYMLLGEYDTCITIILETIKQHRKHQSLVHLGSGISYALAAAYLIGRWSIVDEQFSLLQEIWEQGQYDSSTLSYFASGYYEVLEVAQARQDKDRVEMVTAILRRSYPDTSSTRHQIIDAIVADDPERIKFEDTTQIKDSLLLRILRLRNEHGLATPILFAHEANPHHYSSQAFLYLLNVSKALASNEHWQLEKAIEALEEQRLSAHAARMRIILAQRTGEYKHIEQARPLLEALQDRQYLCKLEEVASCQRMGLPSSSG
jgi:class 3 adenylate cyclase